MLRGKAPRIRRVRFGAALGLVVGAAGCVNYAAPFETAPATIRSPTRINSELKALPPPQEQIVAAVYRFRDQTGQYKTTEQMASWSTAVTQGATSILMRALEESGWFVPIEREGLSNLLNERQIIQSIRAQYEGPEGERLGPLPPLLYAGVLLEGGIIGYDTNLLTGGTGVRYFGAGASGQFRQDQVTIYLRAVSTQTGRVLKTVSTTKTIGSQQVEAGFFRFVEVDRLLEAEMGYSFNEPPVVAVTEAVEEAVKNLVVEGVLDGLWNLRDPADRSHPAFARYQRSQERAAGLDPFGMVRTRDRSGFSVSVSGGARQYQGNYRNSLIRPAGELAVRWMNTPRWGVGLTVSAGEIGAQSAFLTTAGSVAAEGVYFVQPRGRASPFLRAGVGIMEPDLSDWSDSTKEHLFPFLSLGGGIEILLGPKFGVSVALLNHYALKDGLDGVAEGEGQDSIWNLILGLAFYR